MHPEQLWSLVLPSQRHGSGLAGRYLNLLARHVIPAPLTSAFSVVTLRIFLCSASLAMLIPNFDSIHLYLNFCAKQLLASKLEVSVSVQGPSKGQRWSKSHHCTSHICESLRTCSVVLNWVFARWCHPTLVQNVYVVRNKNKHFIG